MGLPNQTWNHVNKKQITTKKENITTKKIISIQLYFNENLKLWLYFRVLSYLYFIPNVSIMYAITNAALKRGKNLLGKRKN